MLPFSSSFCDAALVSVLQKNVADMFLKKCNRIGLSAKHKHSESNEQSSGQQWTLLGLGVYAYWEPLN